MSEQGERVNAIGFEYEPGSVIPAIVDGNEWAACFGLSWADMLLHDQVTDNRIIRPGGQYFRRVAGTMGVAQARSQNLASFLDTDAEWCFMVDTDMGFAADTVDRLVSSAVANNVQVLGALCFAQKQDKDMAPAPFYGQRLRIQPTLYHYTVVPGTGERGFAPIAKYRRGAFQQVAATGAACILIHRDVAVAVGPDPFAPITDPDGGGNGTPRTYSEDLSFCMRVHAAGMDIGVDTSIQTTHYKGGIYLDETAYAMQQETLIQAKGHEIAAVVQRRARHYEAAGLIAPEGIR